MPEAHLPVTPVGRVLYIVLIFEGITQHYSKQPSKEGQGCHCQIVPAIHNFGLNRPECKQHTTQLQGWGHKAVSGAGKGGEGGEGGGFELWGPFHWFWWCFPLV